MEMAGAIAEIRNHTLQHEYRNFNPREARVILLEGLPRVFPMFREKLSARAQKDLEHRRGGGPHRLARDRYR